MIFDNEENNLYMARLAQQAYDSTLKKLIKIRKEMSPKEFDNYLETLKDFTKREVKEREGIENILCSFDIIDDIQTLCVQRNIFLNILDVAPAMLQPAYYIASANQTRPEFENPEFLYKDFIETIGELFAEKKLDKKYDTQNLTETFSFLKRPKYDIEQHLNYPELELVFDKKTEEVFANIYENEKLIVENVEFNELEQKCHELNNAQIEKTVTPQLRRFSI